MDEYYDYMHGGRRENLRDVPLDLLEETFRGMKDRTGEGDSALHFVCPLVISK